jgi:antirestriction protein ArdC
MKKTVYETITDQIVAAIEDGAATLRMPWHVSARGLQPINASTGRNYRGLNILMLWMTAEQSGFSSGTWATYQQWKEKGAQVRKGEKSAPVFFWKNLRSEESGEGGDEERRPHFVARAYNVFNSDQVDGYEPDSFPVLPESERIAKAEAFIRRVPAEIFEGGRAAYSPSTDRIEMVPFARFREPKGYYSVLAHELTHWSGAKTRLDRDLSGRFGTEAYAVEELVAELGAAFIGASLGLCCEPREDHAPYIATWLKVLKNDARAIFTAAAKAQAAVDYLMAFNDE